MGMSKELFLNKYKVSNHDFLSPLCGILYMNSACRNFSLGSSCLRTSSDFTIRGFTKNTTEDTNTQRR